MNDVINPDEFKELTKTVVDNNYTVFFDSLSSLTAAIEEKVFSSSVEQNLKKLEDIQAEAQQVFYKEKLILFPFLTKSFEEEDIIEKPQSLDQIGEQFSSVERKIKAFKTNFKSGIANLNEDDSRLIQKKISEFCSEWKELRTQRNKLYNVFLLKKVKRR